MLEQSPRRRSGGSAPEGRAASPPKGVAARVAATPEAQAVFQKAVFGAPPFHEYRQGQVLGAGSYNEVRAHPRQELVLRISKVPLRSTRRAERSMLEAYVMTLAGLKGCGPTVHSFGWDESCRFWSVQERATQSLAEWLRTRVVSASDEARREALRIWTTRLVPQLLRSLALIAALGIYPGDVKPENLVCMRDGRVLLIDFDHAYLVTLSAEEHHGDCASLYLVSVTQVLLQCVAFLEEAAGCPPYTEAVVAPLREELARTRAVWTAFAPQPGCEGAEPRTSTCLVPREVALRRTFREQAQHYFDLAAERGPKEGRGSCLAKELHTVLSRGKSRTTTGRDGGPPSSELRCQPWAGLGLARDLAARATERLRRQLANGGPPLASKRRQWVANLEAELRGLRSSS